MLNHPIWNDSREKSVYVEVLEKRLSYYWDYADNNEFVVFHLIVPAKFVTCLPKTNTCLHFSVILRPSWVCDENLLFDIFLFGLRLLIKLVQKDISMMIFQQKQRKLPSKSHTGKINLGGWQGRLGDGRTGMCCWDLKSHYSRLCSALFWIWWERSVVAFVFWI